ncbi:MAG TPA: 2-oxoacid:acceptor oxidoreductase family protein, partial [bacterium]|nr:2-oxoacid:acceptor oxidoreductase family protein [bacterium]
MENEIIVGIGGAAGDGGASTGDNLALTSARQGLFVYVYTSYQSLIRGGHSWIRLRISSKNVTNVGDQVGAMIALNQDSMDRHLQELKSGGICVYNGDKVKAGKAPEGVQLCPLPVFELAGKDALPIMQNTVALGALTGLLGLEFESLSSVFEHTFKKKPQVVKANIEASKSGYDFAVKTYKKIANPLGKTNHKLAMV